MRILLIEDEPNVASFIKRGLEEHFYSVEIAYDGQMGLKMASQDSYGLIILDIILPLMNGFEICKKIRQLHNSSIPILMLTALSTKENIVEGLDSGADDYLTKPFDFKELLARVRALSRRRSDHYKSEILKVADLTLDTSTKTVTRQGKNIPLTSKEFLLLELMLRNRGRVLSRIDIMEEIWDTNQDFRSNVVDVFVNLLRNKIDKNYTPKLIHTVIGMGYVLKDE